MMDINKEMFEEGGLRGLIQVITSTLVFFMCLGLFIKWTISVEVLRLIIACVVIQALNMYTFKRINK